MATVKDVRVKVRLNVLSSVLRDKGEADQRPGRHGSQRKTIIDCQEVEIPTGELAIRLANAQLVLEDGYMVNTDITPPIVVTDDATGITSDAAIFRGHVNPNGLSTAVRFEYSRYIPSMDAWVVCDETPLTGATNQSVHKDMAGLTPDTKYYYRVRGYNAAKIAYGIVKSFHTDPTP